MRKCIFRTNHTHHNCLLERSHLENPSVLMEGKEDGERILLLTLKQADARLENKARVRFALPYSWPNINWIVA